MSLAKLFGKYDKMLKKYCKEQMKNGNKSTSDMWICDNYRLCSLPLKAAVRYISSEGEKNLEPLFLLCKELFTSEKIISAERISAKLSSEKLTVGQCEGVSVLLYAAASAVICDNLYNDNSEVTVACIKSIIKLGELDFDKILYEISSVERLLCSDPAEIYEKMSGPTKRMYRKAVARGAEKAGKSENEYMREILEKARSAKNEKKHIGFYLPFLSGKRITGIFFIVCEWLTALLFSLAVSLEFTGNVAFFPILILPFYAVIKPVSDYLCSLKFPVFELPKMSAEELTEGNTLITVSSLMPSASKHDGLEEHLSALYSTNSLKNVKVMLLLDMKSSRTPDMPFDEADKAAVRRLIDTLNEKHGGGFCMALRDRVYSPSENEYTGFERKRGAVSTFIQYLCDGNANGFSEVYGDVDGIFDMKYILALDSDTQLSFEVLRELLSAAEHPLNAPVYDMVKRRTVSGYGVFCPRNETSAVSEKKTFFSRIFTNSGSVSYSPNIHERYSDMFHRGIFCGKGLINIEAYNRTCVNVFEENRILSHDILEGSLLGTAFVSECEFTDSFPSSPDSFLIRADRWIRGDVQNLRYIFRPLGKNGASPKMPMLGKYQLADNFRRALTPVINFILLLASCFLPQRYARVFLYVALMAVVGEYVFPVIRSFLSGGFKVFSSLYFSSEISGVQKDALRCIFSIGFLPRQAVNAAKTVVKALYRSVVSKKKLLQWTTAAQGDSVRVRSGFEKYFVPCATAAVMFVFGTSVHRLLALFVLAFLPVCIFGGIKFPPVKQRDIGENEREVLTSFAASAWKFFGDNVTERDNFLPPDNIQETPVPKKAARTSPTNIGMYLVSILASADMSFISVHEMLDRIDKTLTSVEKLPKYKGLLYNWYDTERMCPLSPEYVSTVDCGNFLVCLTALKQGLREYSEAFPFSSVLMMRIDRILNTSDLGILYDRTKNLFRIGIDCQSGSPSQSFYDIYMSEARMTSYYECARRHVPVCHWHTLDRTLKRTSGYITAASWSGTMFEYFMPALFLKTETGTFSYEALRVCLYIQKKRAEKHGVPYGISESCFYSVDNSLNYKYKAHGIKSMALNRNADEESVISPYSVFLTLPFERATALKNLSALSALHSEGIYGFYEAVDFTANRTDGEHYAIVRCYMSHHVGMSIISVANVLFDDIFVKRFMSDPDMASAVSLLKEKIPSHPTVTKFPPEKSLSGFVGKKTSSDTRTAPEDGTGVFAYSNGDVTVFCDEYGRNRCVFGSYEPYGYSRRSEGVSVGADFGNGIVPLFPVIDSDKVELKRNAMYVKKNDENTFVTAAVCVHPSENALLIPVKIENTGKQNKCVNLFYYLEPFLLPSTKEDPHPAFSDMFTEVKFDEKNGIFTFYKKNSASSPVMSIGFCGKNKFDYSLDRESVLARKTDRKSVFDEPFKVGNAKYRGVNPVLALSTQINVNAGAKTECVLAISFGFSENQTANTLVGLSNASLPNIAKCGAATFLRDKVTFPEVCNYISRVYFGGEYSQKARHAAEVLKGGISSLWKTGISGDKPIITVFPDKSCPPLLQKAYIRLFKRLAKCSIPADLVFIFEDSSEYGFSGERELVRLLKEEEVYDAYADRRGIYVLYKTSVEPDSLAAVLALSAIIYPEEYEKSEPCRLPTFSLGKTEPLKTGTNGFVENGFEINNHPLLPWCHTLSNSVFGTLVSDRSLGYTWAMNSRQNKLTPWSNDTVSDFTGERLFVEVDGKMFDPLAFASVRFDETGAFYASRFDGILCCVGVNVPKKGMFKKVTVGITNSEKTEKSIKIFYGISPVLGENRESSKVLQIKKTVNGFLIKNPLNEDYPGVMYFMSEGKCTLSDNMGQTEANVKPMPTILQKIVLGSKEKHKVQFGMYFARSEQAAIKSSLVPFEEKDAKKLHFCTGYEKLDEFANALLYHQVHDTRINARCGFYQCSGAFGFRDQLQDILPLIGIDDRKVRQMIFKAAAAQFPEGDVLHWFHTVYSGHLVHKGVRSRCSDDKLWLLYAINEYVEKTGDTDILFKKIPFLKDEKLRDGENQRYSEYVKSDLSESLYIHCINAARNAVKLGRHSLPLIGTGDWNDSFDLVGEKGEGESVWLAMFMKKVFSEFAKICDFMKDTANAEYMRKTASLLSEAVDLHAWNGEWYLRGFYDDGTPLGDMGAKSCEIDLLCQAWARLCDMPNKNRVNKALKNAYERLFDEESGTVALFSPPFGTDGKKTGYVNFYPEGMRENGGQYTHAAMWFLLALFKNGQDEQAEKILYAVLPSVKYENGRGDMFKTEPYALSGDVYTAENFRGRGGWSLYTGSAGWLLSLARYLDEKNG